MTLLLGYPNSVRVLADTRDNVVEPVFFRRLSAAAHSYEGEPRRLIESILSMRSEECGNTRLKKARASQQLMTATEAASALGIEKARIRIMADAGVFGARAARGRERHYDWFSAEDLARARMFLDGRVFLSVWAKQSGLSPVDVRQMVGAGLLRIASGADVEQVFGAALQLERESRLEFETSLLANVRFSRGAPQEWVSLPKAFEVVGGSYKPWAPILAAALAGTLPFGLAWSGRYGLKIGALRVHRSVADDLRRRAIARCLGPYRITSGDFGPNYPSTLTRTEAESLLNCYPADISSLIERRDLKIAGRNPVLLDAASVEAFAARHISSREVAALLGWQGRDVRWALADAGYCRTPSGFWRRSDIWGASGALARFRRERSPIVGMWELPGPPNSGSDPAEPRHWPATRSSVLFARDEPAAPWTTGLEFIAAY